MKAAEFPLASRQTAESIRLTTSAPHLHIKLQGTGTKAPIVLSHALGLDMSMWDWLAVELAGVGHPVLRYDHRGHGGSAVPPGPYSMDDLVADAARVVREWRVGPVVWVGLSMGGMVGQGLAIEHAGLVRGLVLANTTSQYPEAARTAWIQRMRTVETSGMAAVADMVTERYLHAEFRTAHHEEADAIRRKLLDADSLGYVASCHAVARVDWLSRLNRIGAPTLLIAGALDAGAPVSMAEAIHRQIPLSRLAILEDASHLSVAEQPDRFLALVQDFVASLH